jgi:TusA-related sulfurtransferase
MVQPDKTLDIRGAAEKRAVQLAREVLGPMRSGQVLKLVTGDQQPRPGIVALCREEGYDLLDTMRDDAVFSFLIRR